MNDFSFPATHRNIFCNRTLNLRSVNAIGYDMDYTLIHYHEEEWEKRAYEHLRLKLMQQSFPIAELTFDPLMVSRGLVLDIELGNILKTNRFGYIKQAYHGTKVIEHKTMQQLYSRTIVSLAEERFIFLNTIFSLSEGCMYAQLVDLLDSHLLPTIVGYSDLYAIVRRSLDAAHTEGELKAEIVADPKRFVVVDEDTPIALLDQKEAGKKLILITNSDWLYTKAMMSFAFDPYLPQGITWRDLFEIVIVSARKPDFFTGNPLMFEIVESNGLLKPVVSGLQSGHCYFGGNAKHVEEFLNLSGDEILYIGDHLFTDVHVTKNILRWRTGLIMRELENEIIETDAFAKHQAELIDFMNYKRTLEFNYGRLKLIRLRQQHHRLDTPSHLVEDVEERIKGLLKQILELDKKIIPLVEAAMKLGHPRWGLMMQAGNDKSLFARQVEQYADIYMSRVSNFLFQSPYTYLRSARGYLPHDLETGQSATRTEFT